MTKVHLLGKAGKKFGEHFNLEVKHTKQLLRAIAVQRKGFYNFFTEENEKGIDYVIKRGSEFLREGEETLSFGSDDVFIMPVPQGSLSDGAKRDLGAILTVIAVILAFFVNPAFLALAAIGSYIMFDGMLGLQMDDTPAKNDEPAIFGGPPNVVKQGVPIPLCYGKLEVTGAPINFGFTGTRIKQNGGWVNINNPDQQDYGSSVGGGGGGGGNAAVKRH
tara:strand:+ start:2783 stop:3439 length:657 start_codon:yes stop_codon:yes gene_type:complete